MKISRIKIQNYANFKYLDIKTDNNIVIVGENKVGKSNFVQALRLILDSSLPDKNRYLGLEHFWDGLGKNKIGSKIEISTEFTDFDNDETMVAHLRECLIGTKLPMVARLTYRFQPKSTLKSKPKFPNDYEFIIFGGDKPEEKIGNLRELRRMFPFEAFRALRDADRELTTWRSSPLKPLIEQIADSLNDESRKDLEESVSEAYDKINKNRDVTDTANKISNRLMAMVGKQHAIPLKLGVAPTQVDSMLRELKLLIDEGFRGISDASLGTSNLVLLTLQSLNLERQSDNTEWNHMFLAIEEPEAYLHPQVQRLVYRHFLNRERENGINFFSNLILTTHSPNIASITPVRSIVLFRHDIESNATMGYSNFEVPLEDSEIKDIQRYIDVTRGEIYFARGVIFVEGDAERFLIPAFAEKLNINLDELGISVCSVGGVNFEPYIKLLGPSGLNIPFVIVTDRDPKETKLSLAFNRTIRILELIDNSFKKERVDREDEEKLYRAAQESGIFVNDSTLEFELFNNGLKKDFQEILLKEQNFGKVYCGIIQRCVSSKTPVFEKKLIKAVERVGKGRFAQLLADRVTKETCPEYIGNALVYIKNLISSKT